MTLRAVAVGALLCAGTARAEVLRILIEKDAARVVIEGSGLRISAPEPDPGPDDGMEGADPSAAPGLGPGPALSDPRDTIFLGQRPPTQDRRSVKAAAHRAAAHRFELTSRAGQLLLDDLPAPFPAMAIHADGTLRTSGRTFRGALEIRARPGGLLVVNALDMEDYVAAVLGSEMAAGWPAEALKAQAVATRTYAVERKLAAGRGAAHHLGSTVLSQVYYGVSHEAPSTLDAARATFGEVLTWQRAPARAYFHAACGGATASAEEAFGSAAPYLVSVPCGDDGASPKARWEISLPLAELSARLKLPLLGLTVLSRGPSGRAQKIELRTAAGRKVLPASELRRLVGYDRIFSLHFDAQVENDALRLTGRGSGHGVGLCQWGARGMALAGGGYREILARYYPGTEVRRMY